MSFINKQLYDKKKDRNAEGGPSLESLLQNESLISRKREKLLFTSVSNNISHPHLIFTLSDKCLYKRCFGLLTDNISYLESTF
jgi:hypothetical protein